MPDIAMCNNTSCASRYRCGRYMAEPNRDCQSYADFKPDEFGICHFFQDVKDFPHKLRSQPVHLPADEGGEG